MIQTSTLRKELMQDREQSTQETALRGCGSGQWTRGQEACWPVHGGAPCQGNSPAGVCWGLCPRTAPLSELGSELERPRKTPSVSRRACPSARQGSVSGRSAPQGTSDLAGHAGHRMAVMQAAAATRASAALCLCTAAMRRLPGCCISQDLSILKEVGGLRRHPPSGHPARRPPQRPGECSPLPTCDDGLLPCPKPILQTPKLGTAVAARAGANHINFTGMFLSSQHWHHSPHRVSSLT